MKFIKYVESGFIGIYLIDGAYCLFQEQYDNRFKGNADKGPYDLFMEYDTLVDAERKASDWVASISNEF